MEEKFEEPYFKENLKLNRRSRINSEKDDNYYDYYNRPPPEPPPINPQTEKIITRKNIVECHDQLTMRKDNYAYFVTTNGTSRENGLKTLKLYHFALSIEKETKDNLSETLNNIKLSIYSLYELSQNLKF